MYGSPFLLYGILQLLQWTVTPDKVNNTADRITTIMEYLLYIPCLLPSLMIISTIVLYFVYGRGSKAAEQSGGIGRKKAKHAKIV